MQAPEGLGADLRRSEFFSRFGNYASLLAAAHPQALAELLKSRPITDSELQPIKTLPRAAHGLGMNL
jgi:hypothetical protein